jgi:hypothetical protein
MAANARCLLTAIPWRVKTLLCPFCHMVQLTDQKVHMSAMTFSSVGAKESHRGHNHIKQWFVNNHTCGNILNMSQKYRMFDDR